MENKDQNEPNESVPQYHCIITYCVFVYQINFLQSGDRPVCWKPDGRMAVFDCSSAERRRCRKTGHVHAKVHRGTDMLLFPKQVTPTTYVKNSSFVQMLQRLTWLQVFWE